MVAGCEEAEGFISVCELVAAETGAVVVSRAATRAAAPKVAKRAIVMCFLFSRVDNTTPKTGGR